MKRDRTLRAAGPGSVGAMKNWRYIALHAVAAAHSFSCCSATRWMRRLKQACCGR